VGRCNNHGMDAVGMGRCSNHGREALGVGRCNNHGREALGMGRCSNHGREALGIGRRFAPPHSVPLQRAARSPWTPHLHALRQSAFIAGDIAPAEHAGGGCGTKGAGSGGAGKVG
jgi:hypothetical protein